MNMPRNVDKHSQLNGAYRLESEKFFRIDNGKRSSRRGNYYNIIRQRLRWHADSTVDIIIIKANIQLTETFKLNLFSILFTNRCTQMRQRRIH